MQVLLGHGSSLQAISLSTQHAKARRPPSPHSNSQSRTKIQPTPQGDLPGREDPHTPLCWQGVPAHTSASCGRAFSCPRSYGACASCVEDAVCGSGGGSLRQGPGAGPPAQRPTPAVARSALKVSSPTAQSGVPSTQGVIMHVRRGRTLPVPTPAAMMVPLAAPVLRLQEWPLERSRRPKPGHHRSSRGFYVSGGPGARAAGWAPKQDGTGLSSLPDPGPRSRRHSPGARRWLEKRKRSASRSGL